MDSGGSGSRNIEGTRYEGRSGSSGVSGSDGGRSDTFCFQIEDEAKLYQVIEDWKRVAFEASWTSLLSTTMSTTTMTTSTNFDEGLKGVTCPVDRCHKDCFRDNFDIIAKWNDDEGGDGGGGARVRRIWILGQLWVLPRMRRDGTSTRR